MIAQQVTQLLYQIEQYFGPEAEYYVSSRDAEIQNHHHVLLSTDPASAQKYVLTMFLMQYGVGMMMEHPRNVLRRRGLEHPIEGLASLVQAYDEDPLVDIKKLLADTAHAAVIAQIETTSMFISRMVDKEQNGDYDGALLAYISACRSRLVSQGIIVAMQDIHQDQTSLEILQLALDTSDTYYTEEVEDVLDALDGDFSERADLLIEKSNRYAEAFFAANGRADYWYLPLFE